MPLSLSEIHIPLVGTLQMKATEVREFAECATTHACKHALRSGSPQDTEAIPKLRTPDVGFSLVSTSDSCTLSHVLLKVHESISLQSWQLQT